MNIADFEAPAEGDVAYHGDNEFQGDLESVNLYLETETSDIGGTEETSWFGGENSGDAFGCSSCSSCSLCSSCGGCS